MRSAHDGGVNNINMPEASVRDKQNTIFQTLWTEALAVKQANDEFEATLDSLVENVEKEVLPMEIELGHLIKQVLYKQLAFTGRRALGRQHRKELHAWIDENVQSIKAMGMADEELLEKAALAHAEFNNIALDRQSDMSISDQVAQYYTELGSQGAAGADLMGQDVMAYGKETWSALDAVGQIESSDENSVPQDCALSSLSSLRLQSLQSLQSSLSSLRSLNLAVLDDTVFQRIFRKTASALHPDKEADCELREKKQILMSVLLDSRKNYDLITMLELHSEYVTDSPGLSDEDKQSLATVLYQFINQSKDTAEFLVNQSSIHRSTYRWFYTSNSKSGRARVQQYIDEMKARGDACIHFVDNVNTIFKLGSALDKRLERNAMIGSTAGSSRLESFAKIISPG